MHICNPMTTMLNIKTYASIVTFHTRHSDLIRLIDCVMKSPIEKLFIIDNSSNDELRDFVKGNQRIHYIHSLNLGYGSGHNIALKKAIEEKADYMCWHMKILCFNKPLIFKQRTKVIVKRLATAFTYKMRL